MDSKGDKAMTLAGKIESILIDHANLSENEIMSIKELLLAVF